MDASHGFEMLLAMFRYALLWFAMLVVAVGNGALRQMTFGKVMPELRAHQLSTAIGSLLIGAVIWVIVRVWPPGSERQALTVGLVWVAMTVAFEFFMGLVLLKRSVAQAMADYNLAAGRVWILFL